LSPAGLVGQLFFSSVRIAKNINLSYLLPLMNNNQDDFSTKSVIDIVGESWNKISEIYAANRNVRKMDRELFKFKGLLPAFGKVLDVGSGAGVPVAKFLAENGFQVIGIDISDTMLTLASKNVPNATFKKMNMLNLEFEKASYDGVICVFSLFHVPRITHKTIFKHFYQLLKPNGVLLLNTGVFGEERFSQFFDVPMFWSSHHPKDTKNLLQETGFSLISHDILTRGGESQYWVFAIKPI
jgi:2-polyprenyl-3-methyl-5-hydroxy-6-metoxy-1,4-benzoquinol methylase